MAVKDVLEKFASIEVLAFDVDGVMTDGTFLLSDKGDLWRRLNVKDGLAVKLALEVGLKVIVISAKSSGSLAERLRSLGIEDIYLDIKDKKAQLEEFMSDHEVSAENILYMGDDLPDLECMRTCGLPACPGDAVNEVRAAADYVSPLKGGEGCVRDVIQKTLKARDKWNF